MSTTSKDQENHENNIKIAKATGIISASTFLSRILGFIRDMIIAMTFGSTLIADAFFVAFRVPNMLRELFAEGSISAGFIPVFTEYLEKKRKTEAKRLIHAAFTTLVCFLLLATLLGIIFTPYIIKLIAPGFKTGSESFELTVYLARIMFPYLFFIGLAALAMGILNSIGVFGPPALSPAVYNITIITTLLILTPTLEKPIIGLAVGVLLGGISQFLIQVPYLLKRGMMFRFYRNPLRHPGVRQVGRLIVPVMIGLSATQINLLVNTILASFLATGSISYLYYAMRLIHFPLGIFGIAVATAVLPMMSRHSAHGNIEGIIDTVSFGLRLVFFITIPAMAGLIFLREPIVNLIYQRGNFDYESTRQTARAVFYYAAGLWSFAGVRIIIQAFYSLKDTKTPVMVSIAAVAINIIASLLLIKPLQHAGLALASVIASVFSISVLQYILKRRIGQAGQGKMLITTGKTIASSAIIVVISLYIRQLPLWHLPGNTLYKTAILFPGIFLSIAGYLTCQHFFKSEELIFIKGIITKGRTK